MHTGLIINYLEGILNTMLDSDILMCGKCETIFNHIPPFEVHKRICVGAPPSSEVLERLDNVAMSTLARDLWKEVVLSEMRNDPNSQKFCK